MLESNRMFFEWLHICDWHDAGYTGKRGVSATVEGWDISDYNFNGQVVMSDPVNITDSAHPINTAKCFFEIAPDRTLIQIPYKNSTLKDETLLSSFFVAGSSIVKSYNIDVMFGSIISSWDGKLFNECLRKLSGGFTYVMNVCNDDGIGTNKMLSSDYVYGIGSYFINEQTHQPIMITKDELLNSTLTCVPTNMYIPYSNGDYDKFSNSRKFSGASSSAAIIGGMMSLINDFFIDKTGMPLSNKNMKKFIRDYSNFIGRGFKGLILPKDPNSIDVGRYATKKTNSNSRYIGLEKYRRI